MSAVGVVIGLSILGDSFLYGILPLEAEGLGIPFALVGVLLSANRLVRLASNTWMSRVFERLGPKLPFALSTVLALLTTSLYGVPAGFLVFLVARLGWGISWSGLRQGGYQAVWTGDEALKGRLMGILWSIVRLGSAISVLVGGYLRDQFGYAVSVSAIAATTALAFPFSLLIQWPAQQRSVPTTQRLSPLSWLSVTRSLRQRWLLLVGMVYSAFEGILISTAAVFLSNRLALVDPDQQLVGLGIGLGTVTGLLLAVRWISGIFFGPLVGALSDRVGQVRTTVFLSGGMLFALLGAVSFSSWLTLICLTLAFLASSGLFTTLNAEASGTALGSDRPQLYVGYFATAIDAGLAVGPLLAYSLGALTGLEAVYLIASLMLFSVVLIYWQIVKP